MSTCHIIFVGGAHGVGKSSLCGQAANALNLTHLSAGKLIQEFHSENSGSTKLVGDVTGNQDALLRQLAKYGDKEQVILLDGHFCVFDTDRRVQPIPLNIFTRISPVGLILVTEKAEEIERRLSERDGSSFSIEEVTRLCDGERKHASSISMSLNVPLDILHRPGSSEFQTCLKAKLSLLQKVEQTN